MKALSHLRVVGCRGASRRPICAAILTIALAALALPAWGQSDLGAVIDRLDRLERQLTTLERGVYRNSAGAGPTAAAAGLPAARLPANLAASMEVRLGEIENQLRELTGKFEQVGHRLGRLDGRLEKLVADVDVRMRTLEEKVAAGGMPEPASSAAAGEGATPQAAAASPLPEGTPEEQYRYAVSRLQGADRDADYVEAERALSAFIEAHPGHDLESNVRYWLGESHYVRRDYSNAAVVFAEAYKAVPQGRKAQDSLLKLGMSLGQIDKAADACNTFAELATKFPLARPEVVTALARERKRYGCR